MPKLEPSSTRPTALVKSELNLPARVGAVSFPDDGLTVDGLLARVERNLNLECGPTVASVRPEPAPTHATHGGAE